MQTRPVLLFFLILLLAAAPVWGAAPASADAGVPQNNVPIRVENAVSRLTTQLSKAGFEVSRGYFKLYEIEDCPYSLLVMNSCAYNNPAAPYILPVMPTWPDEASTPDLHFMFGPTAPGFSATYRLDRREAILILGQLPPRAKYFGMQSYIASRLDTYHTDSEMYQYISTEYPPKVLDTFFHTLKIHTERIFTISSLSNSNNNVVIEQQSGAAFNQMRTFILTGDQTMDARMREALDKSYINPKDIFTEPFPSSVRLGLNAEADDFFTLIRYAEPHNVSQANQWREDLPLVVLRVRSARADWQPVPYGPVVLEQRKGVDEFPLEQDLDSLVSAVFDRWGQAYDPASVHIQKDLQTEFDLVGPDCLEIGMDCLADTQDTAYQAIPGGFLVDTGRIFAYAGVLGTETGNATYVGLGVNDVRYKLGVYNIFDSQLKGSADPFENQVSNTDKMFLHYFARSCAGLETLTGGNCTEITEKMIPLCSDPTGDTCHRMAFSERDYIVPGTLRGPNSLFILPGRVIRLLDPR
jgi:hypothetical protein